MQATTSKKGQLWRMEMDGFDLEVCTRDKAMAVVESIIGYQFSDRTLLEAALTHSSFPAGKSYERLEFVGDAALGHLLTTHLYISYPDLDQGALSLLRAANVNTEKLARAAVKLGLYRFLRRNSPSLDDKVPLLFVYDSTTFREWGSLLILAGGDCFRCWSSRRQYSTRTLSPP